MFLTRALLRSAGLKGVELRGILLVFRPNFASPSLRGDTVNVETDTEMHGPGDQSFSLASILALQFCLGICLDHLGRRHELGELWDCQLGNFTAGKDSGGGETFTQGFLSCRGMGLGDWHKWPLMVITGFARYAKMMNDMNINGIVMEKLQINTKFLNNLQPEWKRSALLTRDLLLKVKDAYTTMSREESHGGILEPLVFNFKLNVTSFAVKSFNNNRRTFNNNTNNTRGSSSNNNVNRGPNPNLNCKNYGKIGHTIDSCFEIVGFPPGLKEIIILENKMQKLLSLINDNTSGSIHANMADKCYIQDLKKEKVSGTGSESGGLYLFDVDKDCFVVLSVLHNDLKISKSSSVSVCEVCHRAKQTRDHFPLSNHKSKDLGELVHLDLWGPYRVPSKEGYKCFLTIIDDDYSIGVWVYLVKSKDEAAILCFKGNALYSRDVKFYETIFPFKMKSKTCDFEDVDTTSASEHLSFFDNQMSQSPYDEGRATSVVDGSVPSSRHDTLDTTFTMYQDENTATQFDDESSYDGNISDNNYGPAHTVNVFEHEDVQTPGIRSLRYGIEKFVCYSMLSESNLCFATNLNKFVKPSCYQDAICDPNWIDVMNSEIKALNRNNTWTVCDLPADRKPIGSNWIYKIKYKSTGDIDRYKARLVAKGFSQREGLDYEETFSPIVKMGDLYEDVYMTLPQGYESVKEGKVSLLVYVDDIVIIGNNDKEIDEFKKFLSSKFLIKDLGKLKYFLGIEILENDKGLCMTQRKYCLELLHEYGLLAAGTVNIPLLENTILNHIESKSDKKLGMIDMFAGKSSRKIATRVNHTFSLKEGVQDNCIAFRKPSELITTTPTLTTTNTATTITADSTRPKAKGIVIHKEDQAPTPTVSSQQPSQVKVQDKGKGKMVEPEPVKKMSKKDLLRLDEELAFKLQAEEEEEERLAREKA
ncbi:ribonuclease H-like domain-containing protein [Tanacetum coccineum]